MVVWDFTAVQETVEQQFGTRLSFVHRCSESLIPGIFFLSLYGWQWSKQISLHLPMKWPKSCQVELFPSVNCLVNVKKTSAHFYNPVSRADELLDHTQLLSRLLRILEPRGNNCTIPNTALPVLVWLVQAASDMVKNILHHHLMSKGGLSTAGCVWRGVQPPFAWQFSFLAALWRSRSLRCCSMRCKTDAESSGLSQFHLSILLNCCFSKGLFVTWKKWFNDREE